MNKREPPNKIHHKIINNIEHKLCTKCITWKPLYLFGKYKGSWDNLYSRCKECVRKISSLERRNKPEQVKQRQKRWEEKNPNYKNDYQEKNRESIKEKKRKYYLDNIEQFKEKRQKYQEIKGEELRKKKRKYYQSNKENILKERAEKRRRDNSKLKNREYKPYNGLTKEQIKENSRACYRRNREKRLLWYRNNKSQVNKVRRLKKQKDPSFRIACNLRKRIWEAMKNNRKSLKTEELIGCTYKFLKVYLENLFLPSMDWKNYGKWHIDHIIECYKFDLSKVEEQKKCFHYTNMQPLWAADNLSKR